MLRDLVFSHPPRQQVVQFNSIQKLYLKMVTQLVYDLSSLRPSNHVNNTTQVHRTNTGKHNNM